MSNLKVYGQTEMGLHRKNKFVDLQRIIDSKNIKSLELLYFDEPYIPPWDEVLDFLETNKNLNITYKLNKDFPLFYFYVVFNYYYLNNIKSKKISSNKHLTYFAWLAGSTHNRLYRCELAEELARRNLLSEGKYAWTDTTCDLTLNGETKKFEFNHFKNELKFIDHKQPIDKKKFNNGLPYPQDELEDCIFNIVVEDVKDEVFFSEKTVNTFYVKKSLLLLSSATGNLLQLKKLGFDVHENIIDISYDMITDRKKKVKAFVDQIEKIVNMDINKVYELTKLSRKNNMETLINIVSRKPPYLDDLKQWSLVFNSPLVMKWE